MKKVLLTLLAILGTQTVSVHACTCMGKLTKNTPAFFIDEYEQEQEITESIEAEQEISSLDVTPTTTEEQL